MKFTFTGDRRVKRQMVLLAVLILEAAVALGFLLGVWAAQ